MSLPAAGDRGQPPCPGPHTPSLQTRAWDATTSTSTTTTTTTTTKGVISHGGEWLHWALIAAYRLGA